jgi:predicted amidohydrolase
MKIALAVNQVTANVAHNLSTILELSADAAAQGADLVLFPFARNFDDYSIDQARWDQDEMPEYARRVQMTGAAAYS